MSTSTLEIIEIDVDLDKEMPCEVKEHAEPAAYRVRFNCPKCSNQSTWNCCKSCWNQIGDRRNVIEHIPCGGGPWRRDEVITIIHVY